ncbi:MAG: hypothetical protein WC734_05990 [Patescibacteria group bacterium]|jgi:hypothetical protein
MKRLLAICTTFRRPHELPQMLDTYYATRGLDDDGDMFVYLHNDDPKLGDYLSKIGHYTSTYNMLYVVDKHRCMQEVLNHTCLERYPDYEYYQIITDDARYITPNWDLILLNEFEKRSNGWGFICGDDRLNDNWFAWRHPSMEIWSRKQAQLVGFAYPRTVKHRGQDSYTKELCDGLGICPLVPEVIIRHLQGMLCANPDENLAFINSREAEVESLAGLTLWRNEEQARQIALIKTAWEKELQGEHSSAL